MGALVKLDNKLGPFAGLLPQMLKKNDSTSPPKAPDFGSFISARSGLAPPPPMGGTFLTQGMKQPLGAGPGKATLG